MSDPVTYTYNEIDHDREGMQMPCRDCGTINYLNGILSYGCYECNSTARDVTIEAKK